MFNGALAKRFNKLVPNSFRIIADGDMVTGLPPFGYKHVGTVSNLVHAGPRLSYHGSCLFGWFTRR